jgi:ribosomal protein L2
VGPFFFPVLLSSVLRLVADMSTDDHPHGGGRGKSKGNRNPVSPWGQPSKGGFKTRTKSNVNKWVVTPRVRNMGKRRDKNTA